VDPDTDNISQELLDRFAVTPSEIPVVICSGRAVLRNPSNQELADSLGFNTTIDESQVRDLIIVGAGPAGLADELVRYRVQITGAYKLYMARQRVGR
jgi:thioredoxin reductase (NADPH)